MNVTILMLKVTISTIDDFKKIILFLKENFASYNTGLSCAEKIKNDFDSKWSPHWHVIIGKNFGSFVTHETKKFIFFYIGDKAVMMFKAG